MKKSPGAIYRQVLICLFHLLLFQDNAYSQIITRRKAKASEIAPKAILVMLPTYARRAEYLKDSPTKLAQLKKDRDSIVSKIVMDFNDNFIFAPVYYFVDVDRDRIAAQEFGNVLMDTSLRTLQNVQLDTPYQIVYFGYPTANTQTANGNNDDDILGGNQSNASNQRLVVLNSDMTEVRKPRPNGANNAWGGKTRRDKDEYRYTSPRFDIYYRPHAKNLSTKMMNFYRIEPVK
jgi:hypothetical protein